MDFFQNLKRGKKEDVELQEVENKYEAAKSDVNRPTRPKHRQRRNKRSTIKPKRDCAFKKRPQGYSFEKKRVKMKVVQEQNNNNNNNKTYLLGLEGVPALRGVSMTIDEGEFIVILGKSGGGKTSMLNIMGTIDKPTKGDLYICGKSYFFFIAYFGLHNIRINLKKKKKG
ncbi:ABC transporter family protein [Reticulomyxa filosa]|uniref:ABC transporter family protein n=1 Tax=Reticulomyxa filosa TaxID=46433 RepID=X6P394_RETFI|nr:ABC transporter family protein [Reticulomyxa filosa]|eukprot:ETO32037.1 ABC transporter family protein [Reticulomyxa filosa]